MARRTDSAINFTKAALNRIEAPTDTARTYHYDTRFPGLALCTTRTGVKSFYLCKRVKGRSVRHLLGRYPETTIEQARRRAGSTLGEISEGKDPQATRRTIRSESTFAALFDTYMAQHAKPNKRSWQEDQRQYDKYLKTWQTRRLSGIKTADVASLHARLGRKSGHYQANRAIALVRSVFNFARSRGWNGQNPAVGVKPFREKSRSRFLDGDELKRLFEALAEEPDLFRDFFLGLLLTGARRSNVQAMRWDDLDLSRGLWRINEAESKSGEPLTVVLPPPCVRLLQRRREEADGSEYVFPTCSKTGHLTEPKTSWKRILKHAKLTDCRIHDLRRTLGSWQAAGGASLPIIGASLGHKSLAATQIYARLSVDPIRESVGKAADAMILAGNGTEIINGGPDDE